MSRSVTDLDYELLSAYLDGALSDSEQAGLETRLQNEPSLRHELDALSQTLALVKQLPPLKAPRNFTLDARMVRPSRLLIFPTTTAFSALSAIAAILIFVVAGLLFMTPSLASRQSAAPSEPQGLAFSPTQIITADGDYNAANNVTTQAANIALPTQAPSPLDTPEEVAADSAAADEQESTGSSLMMPTSTLVPPSAAISAPAMAGEAEGGQDAQSEQATDQLQQAAPAPAPTIMPGFFGYDSTPTDVEVGSLASDAESRQMTEETATVLNDAYTVAQAESTPELRKNEESITPSLTITATLPATTAPEGVIEVQKQESDPNLLANVLLAVGVILLILAVATTLARRRR